MPTAFLMDSSLVHKGGHNYDLTRKYARVFRKNGFKVLVIANKCCDFEFIGEVPVLRILVDSLFVYQNSSNEFNDDIQSDALQMDCILRHNNDINSILVSHTSYASTYAIFLRIIEAWQDKIATLPNIHLVTPYCLDTMPKNGHLDIDALQILEKLEAKNKENEKIAFWAENEALAQYYNCSVRKNMFSGLGMPLQEVGCNPSTDFAGRPRESVCDLVKGQDLRELVEKSRNNNRIIVSFLGGARDEKGFLMLPNVITNSISYGNLRNRVLFFVHYTEPRNGFSSEAAHTVRQLYELAKQYPDNVILNHQYLDPAEYSKILYLSTALLCLYDIKRYRFRGSSIVFDAVAAGCAIVGPRGTICDWSSFFFKSLLYHECKEIPSRLTSFLCNEVRWREVLRAQARLFCRRMSDDVIYSRIARW